MSEKTGKFIVRISPELHERLVQLAATQHRSLNQQVEWILESYFHESMLLDRLDQFQSKFGSTV